MKQIQNNEWKDIQVNIIGVIETAMSFRKITADDLAISCAISTASLQKVFDCKKQIDFILLAKIQKALNIKFEVRGV